MFGNKVIFSLILINNNNSIGIEKIISPSNQHNKNDNNSIHNKEFISLPSSPKTIRQKMEIVKMYYFLK